jgi:DNA-binding MarR family transcriptional regulator
MAKRSPPLRFDADSTQWIGLRLAVISNRYNASLYAEVDRELGLQRDDVAVLACLEITLATTAQEIVRYTGRPKNSISRAVTALEEAGFLNRSTHPNDGRAATLGLTAEGREAVSQIGQLTAEHDARLTAKLSEGEKRELTRLLNVLGGSSFSLDGDQSASREQSVSD